MAFSNEKFIIHTEEFEIIKDFSDEDMGKLFKALLKFVQTGEETELPTPLKIAFGFISSHVKRDIDKYNDVSEKRRAAGRRNGLKEREAEDAISGTDENKIAKQSDFRNAKENKSDNKILIESDSEKKPSKESKSSDKVLTKNVLNDKASAEKSMQSSKSIGYPVTQGGCIPSDSKSNGSNLIAPTSIEDGFEDFWMHYPKKVNKAQAREEYFALAPSQELHSEMIESLERQKRSINWGKEEGRFIPHASKWLKSKRWEDEVETENEFYDQSFDTMKFFEAAVKKSMGV